MSISTSQVVNEVYGKILESCKASSGDENSWKYKDKMYSFEPSTRMHKDGAITGTIFVAEGESKKKSGQFRIEGNGVVSLGPKFLKQFSASAPSVQQPVSSVEAPSAETLPVVEDCKNCNE